MTNFSRVGAAGLLTAALTTVNQASATPMIEYSTTGTGAFTALSVVGSGNAETYLGGTPVAGGLTVGVTSVQSNAPGSPTISETLSASVSVSNTTASAKTLYLSFGDTGFTMPSSPPALTLDSHIGGTVPVTGGVGSVAFTSYVDPSNGQNSISGTAKATPTGVATVPVIGSFNNDQFLTVTALGTPYSMTELLKVTLAAGSQINFSASTTLTPVPEPLTLGLLGVGLAGIGMVRRRRTSIR